MAAYAPIRPLFRFLLFVSSYFPAFLILCILLWTDHRWLAWAALGTGLLGLGGMFAALAYLHRQNPRSLQITKIERADPEAMTYVVSYVVPFLSGMLEGRASAIAFTVFFVVLGVLYANSNLIHINPMLNLVGYQVRQVELDGEPVTLISRRRLIRDQTARVASAGDDLFLHVGEVARKSGGAT